MKRKILIVHHHSQSEGDLQEKVNCAVRDCGSGWEIVSATTAVAMCHSHSHHIYVQWVVTVVIEKE
jgi:hypothetical protein